ncbi:acyl-CoA dehydrogenase, partial [miscellaneous Crenarchaeota group-15 archaeon DG-45]
MNFELTDEQKDIRNAARAFCDGHFTKELALHCDREEAFPTELHGKAADLGFLGIHFPEEYGGQGYGFLENAIVA